MTPKATGGDDLLESLGYTGVPRKDQKRETRDLQGDDPHWHLARRLIGWIRGFGRRRHPAGTPGALGARNGEDVTVVCGVGHPSGTALSFWIDLVRNP